MAEEKKEKVTRLFASHLGRFLLSVVAATLLFTALLGVVSPPCFADQAPAADPAGIATGDKTSVTDAAGNPFVPPAPTDTTAPDYAQKK